MKAISRREFLGRGTAGILAAGYFLLGSGELEANPLGLPMGCQVYPIRDQLMQDFDGTLKTLTAIGYRTVDFCAPADFVNAGFAPIANMKGSEIRQKATAAGLEVVSCHFQFHQLQDHLDERIAFASDLGLRDMIVATLAIPATATMDDWRRAADVMNKLGERVQAAGMQLGYHNHRFEFQKIGDTLIFDELMSRFDPKLIKNQFQVANAFDQGYDPVVYLNKYPGRFVSLHLQDWLLSEKKNVPIGQGSMDWRKIFTAAKTGGIQYYFVEMEMDALRASYGYLRELNA